MPTIVCPRCRGTAYISFKGQRMDCPVCNRLRYIHVPPMSAKLRKRLLQVQAELRAHYKGVKR